MNISNNKWFSFLYVKEGRKDLILIVLMLSGTLFTGHETPLLIASLFKSFQSTDFTSLLKKLAAVFFLQYLFRSGYQYFINRYLQVLVQAVRSRCYGEWLRSYDLDPKGGTLRNQYPLGEVLARVMNDSEAIRELVTSGSFGLAADVVYVASGFVALFSLNSTIAFNVLVAEALCLAFLFWGSRRMAQAFMDLRATIGKVSREVTNLSGGIAQLYFSPTHTFTNTKANVVFDNFFRRQLKVNNYDAIFYSTADSLFSLLLLVVAIGITMAKQVELSMVAVVIDQIQRAIGPMKGFAGKISNFQRAFTGIRRLQDFIVSHQGAWQSHLRPQADQRPIDELIVDLKSFTYPIRKDQETPFSLSHIEFRLRKGMTLGLVGPSGCGKSTLFSLISGDYLPADGSIELKGSQGAITLSRHLGIDYDHYRDHVALVTQDSHVFSDSLAFNLSLGQSGHEDQQMKAFWEQMKRECDYLVQWGISLSTKLSLQSLSSGQKQVIALLRALYMKRDLILLDEINSGMDSALELALRKLTLKAQENAMCLVVAHRLETVIGAGHLLAMDKGKIVGQGTHQELLKTCPLYAEFITHLGHLGTNA